MTTLKFRISLNNSDAECWREIEITPEKSLSKLAEGIIAAFSFYFDHAYGFYDRLDQNYYDSAQSYEFFADMEEDEYSNGDAQSVERTKVKSVFIQPGQRMQFIFDYGDMWRFIVEYTGIGDKVPRKRYPCTTRSVGDAPEQYLDWNDEEDDDDDDDDDDDEIQGMNAVTGKIIEFPKR